MDTKNLISGGAVVVMTQRDPRTADGGIADTEPMELDPPDRRRVDINLATLHWQTTEERLSAMELEVQRMREFATRHINALYELLNRGQG